jgi:hypothetical protein
VRHSPPEHLAYGTRSRTAWATGRGFAIEAFRRKRCHVLVSRYVEDGRARCNPCSRTDNALRVRGGYVELGHDRARASMRGHSRHSVRANLQGKRAERMPGRVCQYRLGTSMVRGVDGSSPSEGLNPANRVLCCLARRIVADP